MNGTGPIRFDTDPDTKPGDTAIVDYGRSVPLYEHGSGYYAALATSVAYGEHLVLIDRLSIDNPAVRYDPVCRDVTHEQLGPVPADVAARIAKATRPRCGHPNRHGRPCRVPVAAPGEACAWHERPNRDAP